MAWWERAQVGDKVVCIAEFAGWINHGHGHEILPKCDVVYTVRNICVDYERVAFRFVEIENEARLYRTSSGMIYIEPAFQTKYFKPVQSTETGMTILRALLTPSSIKIPEDA